MKEFEKLGGRLWRYKYYLAVIAAIAISIYMKFDQEAQRRAYYERSERFDSDIKKIVIKRLSMDKSYLFSMEEHNHDAQCASGSVEISPLKGELYSTSNRWFVWDRGILTITNSANEDYIRRAGACALRGAALNDKLGRVSVGAE